MELGSHHLTAHSCSYTTTYTHCSIGFSPRVRTIRAAAEGGEDGADRRRRGVSLAADGPRVVEVTAARVAAGAAGSAGFGARDAELAMWDKLGAVVRLSYGIGIYGAMALTGRFICMDYLDWRRAKQRAKAAQGRLNQHGGPRRELWDIINRFFMF